MVSRLLLGSPALPHPVQDRHTLLGTVSVVSDGRTKAVFCRGVNGHFPVSAPTCKAFRSLIPGDDTTQQLRCKQGVAVEARSWSGVVFKARVCTERSQFRQLIIVCVS